MGAACLWKRQAMLLSIFSSLILRAARGENTHVNARRYAFHTRARQVRGLWEWRIQRFPGRLFACIPRLRRGNLAPVLAAAPVGCIRIASAAPPITSRKTGARRGAGTRWRRGLTVRDHRRSCFFGVWRASPFLSTFMDSWRVCAADAAGYHRLLSRGRCIVSLLLVFLLPGAEGWARTHIRFSGGCHYSGWRCLVRCNRCSYGVGAAGRYGRWLPGIICSQHIRRRILSCLYNAPQLRAESGPVRNL